MIKAVCWDFDGVLMMPWSHPEEPFAQTRAILKHLRANGVRMAVTSFNPVAWLALDRLDLTQYFEAFRIGSNSEWEHHDLDQYDGSKHRNGLCKSKQMEDILTREWTGILQPPEVMLIDDDEKNTAAAIAAGFQALFVQESFLGPNWSAIHARLSHLPAPAPQLYLQQATEQQQQESALSPPQSAKMLVAMKFLHKLETQFAHCVNDVLSYLGEMSKRGEVRPAATKNVQPTRKSTPVRFHTSKAGGSDSSDRAKQDTVSYSQHTTSEEKKNTQHDDATLTTSGGKKKGVNKPKAAAATAPGGNLDSLTEAVRAASRANEELLAKLQRLSLDYKSSSGSSSTASSSSSGGLSRSPSLAELFPRLSAEEQSLCMQALDRLAAQHTP